MSDQTPKTDLSQVVDKLNDPLELALNKILSARFLVTVGLAATLCFLAWKVVDKFSENKELVALVVGQFIFVCKDVILKYFDRNDRKEQPKP